MLNLAYLEKMASTDNNLNSSSVDRSIRGVFRNYANVEFFGDKESRVRSVIVIANFTPVSSTCNALDFRGKSSYNSTGHEVCYISYHQQGRNLEP